MPSILAGPAAGGAPALNSLLGLSPNTQSRLVGRCAPSSGIRLARQAEPGSPTFANGLEYSPIGKRIILENVRRNFFSA